jgi:putative hydrolase of the HAD superfamily
VTGLLIQCVVFDLDDTLYLERDYVRSGFCAVGRHLEEMQGLQGFASVAWQEFEAGRRGDIFDRVLSGLGHSPDRDLVREMVGVYRNHVPTIVLEPDALGCLQMLYRNVELALITDGPADSQRAKLKALQLERWIDAMVVTDELGEGFGKPHPKAFELVEEEVGCSGDACLYVADNPAKDFHAPNELGWWTFRCRRDFGLYADEKDAEPVNTIATDLCGLPDLVMGSL